MPASRSLLLRTVLGAAVAAFMAHPAAAADLTIGIPGWPSAAATAHVLGEVIEEELGLTVAYEKGDVDDLFAMLERGEVDIFPEIWLPNHRNYVRDLAESKRVMSMISRGVPAQQGICATRYTAETLGLRSVDDLMKPEVVAALDSSKDGRGEMWIGAPDWSSTKVEKVRAKSYGYAETMQLLESDERTAMAALDVAVAVERPFVFYCYEPHHMFILHDIVILNEPGYDPTKWNIVEDDDPDWLEKSEAGSAWGLSFIHIGYANRLKTEHPKVVDLLEEVDLEADAISEMTYALTVERKEPKRFAREWIMANDDRVRAWSH